MAKETLFRIFGYRRCATCEILSNAGWCDESGEWHCEECQMNCLLDMFSPDFNPPSRPWLTRCLSAVPTFTSRLVRGTVWCATGGVGWLGWQGLSLTRTTLAFRKAPHPITFTRKDFESEWLVVVDTRKGNFSIGDPVETKGDDTFKRGVIRQKARNGSYLVNNGTKMSKWFSPEEICLDQLRVRKM
mmetsp:Transcript_12881/g.20910  ORF Transcript_12881/g.20910 Transcript_12881/m.20910 type:complete len:187 (-) Transcript_12881:66-626(-)